MLRLLGCQVEPSSRSGLVHVLLVSLPIQSSSGDCSANETRVLAVVVCLLYLTTMSQRTDEEKRDRHPTRSVQPETRFCAHFLHKPGSLHLRAPSIAIRKHSHRTQATNQLETKREQKEGKGKKRKRGKNNLRAEGKDATLVSRSTSLSVMSTTNPIATYSANCRHYRPSRPHKDINPAASLQPSVHACAPVHPDSSSASPHSDGSTRRPSPGPSASQQ